MKIEMHLHTDEVSPCGKVPAEEGVRAYRDAGYDALVVTDHFGSYPLDDFPGSPREKVERFLTGYYLAKEAGEKYGVRVFFGAEPRLEEGPEDFLIYGVPPQFLLDNPLIYTLSLPRFHREVREAGGILLQAHPFRPGVRPREAQHLDGIEVYNGNPRHNSLNRLAAAHFAAHAFAARTSGSDFHQMEDLARGGMIFPREIANELELRDAILAGTATLLQPEGE